ncbi:MAG TPA: DNA polymerase IV [Bacteroidetes bacterium]|nr:DNA polymerase IV [Bacteroidota bacterium]
MDRKILHIDMDAFFASIEQKDRPELKGRPVVVGSDSSRGVVAAASYEARKYGIRSAMPSITAKRLCPGLVFTKHRMYRYREVSSIIFDIFHNYSPLVEALSIDEAFLDVSMTAANLDAATAIARNIKKEIRDKTGLGCSAGISVNKFLAKLSSDVNKPDGLYIIYPSDIDQFICSLPIERFFGIGKVTAEKMHRFGIHTGTDLRRADLSFLERNFGKAGMFFYDIARGIDNRKVEAGRIRKSIGAELTFEKDLTTDFEIIAELYKLEKELWARVEKQDKRGKTLTVKVKFDDFRQITKSYTLDRQIDSFSVLHSTMQRLREQIYFKRKRVRLLGVSISNLEDEHLPGEQLKIWI